MASIDWPNTLPCPMMAGYSETIIPNVIRSDMDTGPDKVRRRSTAVVTQLTFNLNLTREQSVILDDFYFDTTLSGTLAFNFYHLRKMETVECRFVDAPALSSRSGYYIAQIKLEVLPQW